MALRVVDGSEDQSHTRYGWLKKSILIAFWKYQARNNLTMADETTPQYLNRRFGIQAITNSTLGWPNITKYLLRVWL